MVDQADRNPREQNQQGGANKPRQLPDEKDEPRRGRGDQEGRDEPPAQRPGGEKSPWLGGG